MKKTFMDAVEQCSKESTKAGKLEAIKGVMKHHQRLIHEALNKHRRFNVRDWDKPKYSNKDYPIMIPFYKLLDDLTSRRVTGNAARQAVTQVLGMYTKRTADALTRVLLKDLDCGAAKETWLKVYPELDLPDFQVMLAKKMESKYRWKFPCQAEVKYNGYRLVGISNEGEVSLYSRSGRDASQFKGLFDDELQAIERELGYPVVVDGEVLGASFQDTAQAKGKKNVEQKKRLRFFAFDMMPLSDWVVRSCSKLQAERTYDLAMVLAEVGAEKIIMADARVVNSLEEATDFYNLTVKHGEKGKDEGLIIKDPDGLYEWTKKRSGAWTKWKPAYTYDLKVYGYKPGHGKFKGLIGSLKCKGKDENGRFIKADASGMNDKTRKWFTDNQEEALGLIVELECGEVTQAKNKEYYSLRFPQFKQIRWDKSKRKPF